MAVQIKRVYESASSRDGRRYLVDRVWPRGVRKEDLALDGWMKEAAPSPELRKWFNHDPEKWPEFRRRYFRELQAKKEALEPLQEAASKGKLTLLYAAKDSRFNNAAALKEFLEGED